MNPNLKGMTPFIVMEVLEKAQEMEKRGIDVVHLEVGEPDFNMPPCVAAAAQQAYDQNRTHYTHSLGDPELREAIAVFYRREYGVTVDPGCILVTSGSSPAILLALQALCAAGDEVILSNPGYPCYRNFALACHASPKEVRVQAAPSARMAGVILFFPVGLTGVARCAVQAHGRRARVSLTARSCPMAGSAMRASPETGTETRNDWTGSPFHVSQSSACQSPADRPGRLRTDGGAGGGCSFRAHIRRHVRASRRTQATAVVLPATAQALSGGWRLSSAPAKRKVQ